MAGQLAARHMPSASLCPRLQEAEDGGTGSSVTCPTCFGEAGLRSGIKSPEHTICAQLKSAFSPHAQQVAGERHWQNKFCELLRIFRSLRDIKQTPPDHLARLHLGTQGSLRENRVRNILPRGLQQPENIFPSPQQETQNRCPGSLLSNPQETDCHANTRQPPAPCLMQGAAFCSHQSHR